MSIRDGYKMTEFGQIPYSWDTKAIIDLPIFVSDGNYSSKYPSASEFVTFGIPFIRANNMKNGRLSWNDMRYISFEKHAELKKGHLKPKDVLITTRGDLGNIAFVDNDFDDANINAQLALLRCTNDSLYADFLFHAMSSDITQKQIEEAETGTALKQLPIGRLVKIHIPLPPLPEQQKIADILSTVDEHIVETESLIEKTKVIKQGMMQHLLIKGIGHTEFKDTEIGRIPVEWEVKRICEIGELKKSSVDKLCIDGETPRSLINYMDVYRNNKLYRENVSMLISATEKEINEYSISSGDVLITPTSETPEDIGRFSVVYDELPNTLYSYHLTRLRVKMPMYIDYKAYFLSPEYVRNQFRIRAQGSTRFVISNSAIGECIVPLPPYSEQKQIASILSSIDDQISFSEIKLTALTKLKSALMQQLLTGKTRVKV